MRVQVKALKEGKTVDKPIYNHVSGELDPAESISAPKILIIEGLHPFYDDRISELCDYRIYLDISDDVKFAWKIQRDAKERGHSVESIQARCALRVCVILFGRVLCMSGGRSRSLCWLLQAAEQCVKLS